MSDLRGARVLVAGAGGFIGARITRTLVARGALVTPLVRPGGSTHRLDGVDHLPRPTLLDVRDPEVVRRTMEEVAPDYVINLVRRGGARQAEDAASLLETNAIGALHLARASAAAEVRRLVHFGSSQEYGWMDRPIRESDAPTPATVYAATKTAATALVLATGAELGLPAVVLRPFAVYGPGEPSSRLVSTAIRAAISGEELPLSPKTTRRDWIYVDDIVEACLRALTAPGIGDGTVLNVGTGWDRTNLEVVRAVEAACGMEVRLRSDPSQVRAVDTERWVADPSLTARLLGWRATRTLEQGVAEMVRELRSRAAAPAP